MGMCRCLAVLSLAVLLPSTLLAEEKIAFIRGANVWVMTPDGSAQTQLTWQRECRHPCWSPDGRHIVYSSAGNLWRITLADRSLTRLTDTRDCHQPAWRPDTDEIWFVRVPPLGADGWPDTPATMWRLDSASGDLSQLNDAGEAWGPQGTQHMAE